MKTKTYRCEEFDCEIFVEEMSKREAIEYAKDFVEAIERAVCQTDMSVYVEYEDGSSYCNIDGDESGTFRKTNIKAIILDDGYEYYIYGAYTMSANMIPDVA